MAKVPKGWKDAGAGEEQIDHILYDSQLSTTAANTKLNMFKQTEAANGLKLTNMTKANELPTSQRMLIKKITVFFNDVPAGVDIENLLDKAVCEFLINNKRVMAAPMRMFLHESTVLPAGATQDEQEAIGKSLELDNYIVLPGGVNFTFDLSTGDTVAGTTTNITVAFTGELVRSVI